MRLARHVTCTGEINKFKILVGGDIIIKLLIRAVSVLRSLDSTDSVLVHKDPFIEADI
jgi:hypothetical protein